MAFDLLSRFGSSDDTAVALPDGGAAAASASDGTAFDLCSRYDPPRTSAGDDPAGGPVPHVTDPGGAGPADVDAAVDRALEAGVAPSTFVAGHSEAAEGLVAAAFEELRERTDAPESDLAAVESELTAALSSVVEGASEGVAAYERKDDGGRITGTGDGEAPGAPEAGIDYEDVLDRAGIPMFVADATGQPVVWNHALERLTGVEEAQAREAEMLSEAFYHDGRRAQTLADKILEAPESAVETFGVDRVEDVAFTLYSDTSTMTDADGEQRHIDFRAAPLYDGETLVGVVEMIHDRTEDARRHEETEAFVESLVGTMNELKEGNLDARVAFEGDPEYVDDTVQSVVAPFNDLAARFEDVTEQVDDDTEALATVIDRSAAAADQVESQVREQRAMLAEASQEIQGVSATMEEIAASSDEVAGAAERATDAAEEGVAASEDVAAVTDDLADRSTELVDSVTELDTLMADIEDIVDVIADVAEQTNMLALNANIEAARAGQAGSGFSVVADEVKSLAEETSARTDEIRENIDAVQAQTGETVAAVERSHEQITRAEDRVTVALDALAEIDTAVEEASAGITELAAANDEQADTVEGITTTIERVHGHAQEAESAVDDIVAASGEQARLVSELSESVAELSG